MVISLGPSFNPPTPDGGSDFLVEICRNAATVFDQKGFDAASLSELVGRDRFLQGGLYYYLKSKRELLFNVLNRALNRCVHEAVEPAQAEPIPSRRFVRLLRGYIEVSRTDLESISLLFTMTDHLEENRRVVIDLRHQSLLETFAASVEPLLDPTCDISPPVAVQGILGMVSHTLRWHQRTGSLGPPDIVRQILLLALQSLTVLPATLDDVIDLLA